ncbi:Hypothetical predicted protein [Marmota monax]|uniref:Uncharacterized protein n=1 Tax=Marmota monax TaxID=9995 RepID=A0A5E4BWQ6_MARMO|nr:hypothetical protein GHT09_010547 [Marmota monax]VTJ73369.1 Hypothetical predicted protein [Marmota monax]
MASWGLGNEVQRLRERGGAFLLSHLDGSGGPGGDDSPSAWARNTQLVLRWQQRLSRSPPRCCCCGAAVAAAASPAAPAAAALRIRTPASK